jgi:hypothetical protein
MAENAKTVFISYRRSLSSGTARALFQALKALGYDVFMDVESIDSGQFETIILPAQSPRPDPGRRTTKSTHMQNETITFPDGNAASALHVTPRATAATILRQLEIPAPQALVVLNGGTAELAPALQARLASALADGLARVAAAWGLTVITGGTDAGIFHLFGAGLARWGRRAPCIGVAVGSLVTYPGHADGEAPLEPNHSHFVLVKGARWGAETKTLYALAAALAQDCPSLAVFAGGGAITVREMQMNVVQGRPMLLLAGSGRATDAVLAARAGQPAEDSRIQEIAHQGAITPWSIEHDPASLHALIATMLAGAPSCCAASLALSSNPAR